MDLVRWAAALEGFTASLANMAVFGAVTGGGGGARLRRNVGWCRIHGFTDRRGCERCYRLVDYTLDRSRADLLEGRAVARWRAQRGG